MAVEFDVDVQPGGAMTAGLASALVEASAALSDVARSRTANAGSYAYKYADLADVLTAVRPVLHKNGLGHLQLVETEAVGNGVHVSVRTLIVHTSGATFTSPALRLIVPSTDAQRVGAAVTYARRYSLSATLGITTEDDTDGHAATAPTPKRATPTVEPASYRSPEEAETQRLLRSIPADVRNEIKRAFTEHFGAPLSKLPADRHAEALSFVIDQLAVPDDLEQPTLDTGEDG